MTMHTQTGLAQAAGARTGWLKTSDGQPRGYIQPDRLDELWFHTGTACNLSCSFCLEGSKPGDQRLQQPTLAEAIPFIDEAVALGVQQFSFTGGEPFVNRAMASILAHALEHKPCLVLTNATKPLRQRLDEVLSLRERPHDLSFRVSLDAPDAAVHDAERGEGNFEYALETMRILHEAGFGVSVARLMSENENPDIVDDMYREIFAMYNLPEALRIVRFPDFDTPGASPADVPDITENCMTTYQTAESRAQFMCAFSKMIVKIDGRMRVYACTLVDDDPNYDLGGTLNEAMTARVQLRHHRCYTCFAQGASCSEL